MKKCLWFFCFLIILFSSAVRSEEVVVEGEAVPAPETIHSTGTITSIDTQNAMSEVTDVGSMLEESAGVTVKRFGGLGSFSTVMIRGLSPNQVSVFLDGVPLSSAATGIVNLADLPVDALERIDVYRGVAPLGFGDAPIGGVINLVTRTAKKGYSLGGAASYGSFETYKADAFGSASEEKWNALLFYSHMQSEGDFEFLDDNGTPFNKKDDRWVHRKNNDFTSDDFLLKGGLKLNDQWEIFAADEFFNKDAGLPGLGSFRVEDARISMLRNMTYLGARYLGKKAELRSLAYYTYVQEEYRDPEGEIGLGVQESRYVTNTAGANALGRLFLSDSVMLALFAEGRNETYEERDLLNDVTGPESRRLSLIGAAQAEFYFFDARLIMVPTIRVEHYEDHFPGRSSAYYYLPAEEADTSNTYYSPAFGVRATPWKPLSFTANVGKYYRVPTFLELFGDRGTIVGNPDLRAEKGIHSDVGAELNLKIKNWLDSFLFAYNFFYIDVDDIIVMTQNSQSTARSENVSRAELYGHEVAMDAVALGFFKGRVAYTYQVAKDRSDIPYLDGRPLPGRPLNELHTRAALFKKNKGEIFYTFDYLDGNFLDRAGFLESPARRIHGAGIMVTPAKGLEMTFEANNIGDEHVYDLLGYPLPGRSYFGTVRYIFAGNSEE